MTSTVKERSTHSKTSYATGMDRLKLLGDQMEEINQKQDKCANESCIMTRKNNELAKCAKTILEETAELVQEKNKSLYFKSLIIEQLQTLKRKDDREIILHRKRLVNYLDMMCKLERILKKYDITFINNITQKKARRNRIKALIEGNEVNEHGLECDVCGIGFEEKIASEMHSKLLVCNQDMTTNLSTKKHLSNRTNMRQYNVGVRLTKILNNIDLSIKKTYLE